MPASWPGRFRVPARSSLRTSPSRRIRPRPRSRNMAEHWRRVAPYAGLAAVFLIFSLLGPAAFHSAYNLKTLLTQSVIVGVGALGMTLVIISGGIDLSVGSQIALATVLMAR